MFVDFSILLHLHGTRSLSLSSSVRRLIVCRVRSTYALRRQLIWFHQSVSARLMCFGFRSRRMSLCLPPLMSLSACTHYATLPAPSLCVPSTQVLHDYGHRGDVGGPRQVDQPEQGRAAEERRRVVGRPADGLDHGQPRGAVRELAGPLREHPAFREVAH